MVIKKGKSETLSFLYLLFTFPICHAPNFLESIDELFRH